MSTETLFQLTLILTTLLCTLVTGFVLIFAIVVMPGIGTLEDREFLRAFRVIDRVIQNNQPLFLAVWVGSVAALVLATGLGVGYLAGAERATLVVAAALYLVGAQLPTVAVNIPLNNRLQRLAPDKLDGPASAAERRHFERRWNRWNRVRTFLSGAASVLLAVLLSVT